MYVILLTFSKSAPVHVFLLNSYVHLLWHWMQWYKQTVVVVMYLLVTMTIATIFMPETMTVITYVFTGWKHLISYCVRPDFCDVLHSKYDWYSRIFIVQLLIQFECVIYWVAFMWPHAIVWMYMNDHSECGLGQWEEALHINASSHWLRPLLRMIHVVAFCWWYVVVQMGAHYTQ